MLFPKGSSNNNLPEVSFLEGDRKADVRLWGKNLQQVDRQLRFLLFNFLSAFLRALISGSLRSPLFSIAKS